MHNKVYNFIAAFKDLLRPLIKKDTFLWEFGKAVMAQKPVIWLLGRPYQRSYVNINLFINYHCNLLCRDCDIFCSQAPSNERMSLAQVEKFIKESVDARISWENIRILGGEPTLHPDLLDITRILLEYRDKYLPRCLVTLVTNGYGNEVNRILSTLPQALNIENTRKKGPVQDKFGAVSIAPRDLKRFLFADYSAGCGFCHCGIGLTPAGYYPCSVAGAIDRIMGFDLGRRKLPDKDDAMRDQFRAFCPYCGLFNFKAAREEVISPTWAEAYRRYRLDKPVLTKY